MPLQDLLKKQIDQLGKLLAKMNEEALRLREPEPPTQLLQSWIPAWQHDMQLDLQSLIAADPATIHAALKDRDTPHLENMEQLADLLYTLGSKCRQSQQAGNFYRRAESIYHYITTHTATFSFDRNAKMTRLQNDLSRLSMP